MKNILIKNKKIIGFVSAFVFFLFGSVNICHASVSKEAVDLLIGLLAKKIVSAGGWILSKIIGLVIDLAQYDNYLSNPQVKEAWIIIRDFCNMFFILILLFIAFAVMLRMESYSIKKSLPKLLLMAVLINFSRTICGILIDLSQVIMLTFVSAFTAGTGNFVAYLQVDEFLRLVDNNDSDGVGPGDAASMYILAVIFMIVSIVVMLAVLIVFLMRVVMFWIYIVLSPLAFLLSAFPAGQKYASQYWGEFTRYLINGPVLAFFIWMSLSVLANLDAGALGNSFPSSTVGILQGENFAAFVMAIGMLVGGLTISQQIGGIGASWGASTVSNLKNRGLSMAKQGAIGLTKGAIGVATYYPAQVAKRVGYEVGDKALSLGSKAPLIGALALKAKGQLKMKRDFQDEKDSRYIKYLDEKDQDRLSQLHTGQDRTKLGKIGSFLGRGMESSRQDYRKVLKEKANGQEWGKTHEDKKRNKTQWLIEFAKLAGHSITESGEDAFKDEEMGKIWNDFRNSNVGLIDDNEMRAYYRGSKSVEETGHAEATSGKFYEGLKGGDNSEYFRIEKDKSKRVLKDGVEYSYDKTKGEFEDVAEALSPDSMLAYTASRQRMNEVYNNHHENFEFVDNKGKKSYDYLNTVYNEGKGSAKTMAQIRDRGTRKQKAALENFFKWRLKEEQAGRTKSTIVADSFKIWEQANPKKSKEAFFTEMMQNGGLDTNGGIKDPIGKSSRIRGGENAIASSGISGVKVDKNNKVKLNKAGRVGIDFNEYGLEGNAPGKYFQGEEKAALAKKIRSKIKPDLIGQGFAEEAAEEASRQIEAEINKIGSLIAINKSAPGDSHGVRASMGHEYMHRRVDNTFSENEKQEIWQSLPVEEKEAASKKIKKLWGNQGMSEEDVRDEYLTEGLTMKTNAGKKWAMKNPNEEKVELHSSVESVIDKKLKAKGIDGVGAFTSKIIDENPGQNEIRQVIVQKVDGGLQKTVSELINAVSAMGNGMSSLEQTMGNANQIGIASDRMIVNLEKIAEASKQNTKALDSLAGKISAR